MRKYNKKNQRGFSWVELSVVLVIMGGLAAFAVPKFRASVEKTKASEALNYLSAVRTSQERYQSKQGTYAGDVSTLDIQIPSPKYFSVGIVSVGGTGSLEDSWKLTLTRFGKSTVYGAYTITFNQDGYAGTDSTIDGISTINPMRN